jgi:serine/threonine-protein kinase
LSQAHERRLLHRHLKMTNVIIAPGGKLRLCGLGLGALVSALEQGDRNGYPAPEPGAGDPGAGDPRTDLYALGGLLFHGLTGVHPHASEARGGGGPPLARRLVPSIPPRLEDLLSRCLEPDPAARFESAAVLLSDAEGLN